MDRRHKRGGRATPCRDQRQARKGDPEPRQKEGLTMRFHGNLSKDGKWWLAEVPVFDAMTQGRTRKEAFAMIADWFITMVNRKGFSVQVHSAGQDHFEVGSDDARTMISLL